MRHWVCIREHSTVIVVILYSRTDGKYHFVNLTHGHICKCAFDTVEDAIADMEKQKQEGLLIDYKEVF